MNTILRDAANPSRQDPYFPFSCGFDCFNGHCWQKGLFESVDGNHMQSSGQHVHFAYAQMLWGAVSGNHDTAVRGAVMLAVLRRALNEYVYMRADNPHHPSQFAQNRVTGLLFENKVHHTSDKIECTHGMHMMAFTPASAYARDAEWCEEEWATWFDNGRAEQVQGGWRGILFASLVAWDPQKATSFFFAENFDRRYLDIGMSLAYYRALAAEAMVERT